MRPTSKWHFVPGLPNGSPEIPIVGTPATLGPHNFVCRLLIGWSFKQSCNFCQDLSNGMLCATCTQGNRVDFWLLVVGSQTANLIPDLFFCHNLCFRCPNGSCKPILNISVSIFFQWYKKLFNPMGFDAYNRPLNIWESIRTPIPKMGVHLGMWRFIPSHSFALPVIWDVTSGLTFWPATLQALALVMSPRLGLQQNHSFLLPT
jgi:hypothetical protein